MSGEILISNDVETNGPIPGEYSMLSLGAAVFTRQDGRLHETFSANLETAEGAKEDPDTMKWWATQPEAWKAHRENLEKPADAMLRYLKWVKEVAAKHNAKPVFAGYPAGFDFNFVYNYLIKYTGESPYSFSALDIKTLVMATLGCGYREVSKKNMPKHWFGKTRHDHTALTDAIGQGELLCNILNDSRCVRCTPWAY